MSAHITMDDLLPAERMAFSMARRQVADGNTVSPNMAIVCVAALARLLNRPLERFDASDPA